ncbi:MAG: MFS transporter [Verrucomicrobia bacterium]|nr:MFS transporter [Verrucomicrobiota bacterium]
MIFQKSIWRFSFFPILFTYFIDSFGQAVIFPIFTSLLLKPQFQLLGSELEFIHKTALLIGLTAAFPLARMLGAPIIGELSDSIGRKKAFMMTISGGIVGYFLSGWAIHSEELVFLWLGRIISGFFAGNLTLCLAAISDITSSKEERIRNFGIVGTIGSLGLVFAILSGTLLTTIDLNGSYHPELPLLIAGFLSCVNFLLIFFFFKESRTIMPWDKFDILRGFKNIYEAVKSTKIGNIFFVYFFFTLSWSTSIQFLSTYLVDTYQLSAVEIPYVFIYSGLLWAFANFVIIPFCAKYFSPVKTLFFGLLALTIFLLLTLLPKHSFTLFLIYFSIAALCAALCWTSGLVTLSLQSPRSMLGTLFGVNQSIVALAFILGPLAGEIITHFDFHLLYLLTAIFSLIAALSLKRKQYE